MDNVTFMPGPWRVKQNEEFPKILNIQDPTYSPVANVASGFTWMPTEMGVANANLISAAPDMYEALKAIVDSVEIPYCYTDKLVIKAKLALAKADGGTPNE